MYIVCPYCDKQSDCSVNDGWNNYVCPLCKKPFDFLSAKVRAKRSRGDKASYTRHTSVRVLYERREDLIEYDCDYNNDFEIRAGDDVIFSYRKNQGIMLYKMKRLIDIQL